MSEEKLRVIADAVRIRVKRGEDFDAVMDRWPRLYQTDKNRIKEMLGKKD